MKQWLSVRLLLPFFITLLSCGTRPAPPRVLRVDIDRCKAGIIDTARLVRLEANEKSLLFGIDRLLPAGSRYVVASRNKLRTFDRRTGAYICDIARYGSGEADFSDISDIWSRGDTVFVFDCNAKTLGVYLSDGTFIEKRRPFARTEFRKDQPIRKYFTMADGSLLSVNGSTGGSTARNPLVSAYGRDYCYRGPIDGRDVKESAYLMDGACLDTARCRLLIWEPLRDTVFAADNSGVRPLYVVDAGLRAFPPRLQALENLQERLSAFYSEEPGRQYVSLIRYLQPDGDDLYFCLAGNNRRNYIVRYDTATDSCSVRSFSSPDGRYTQTTFFLLDADSLRLEMRDNADIEANPAVYSFHKSEMQ
ncbi:MAG: 6-bladed beta-propeller [Muribaculaceae bacterium]|nr:6-bladed beta-propeller [Muribaculaceae bacterium]